jgi:hypothetical protein
MARSRKKALEPISLEELTNAPAMSGFVSFLNVKPWETSDAATDSTRVEPAGIVSDSAPVVPETATRALAPVEATGVVLVNSRPEHTVVSTPSVVTPVETPAVDYVAMRRVRVQEVRVVQDSLSFGEEALYNALWANATPHNIEARRITIGFERMSRVARLTDKNCKLNCRALMQKRIVEEIADTNFREGRTYLIYNSQAALVRQRQSGLTHVVRTRGVVFVDPGTGRELTDKQYRRRRATRVVSTGVEITVG